MPQEAAFLINPASRSVLTFLRLHVSQANPSETQVARHLGLRALLGLSIVQALGGDPNDFQNLTAGFLVDPTLPAGYQSGPGGVAFSTSEF